MPPASKHRPRSLCPSSSAPSARRGQKAEPKAEILSATSGTTPATPQKTSDPGGGSQHTEQQLQALSQTNRASGLTHTCAHSLFPSSPWLQTQLSGALTFTARCWKIVQGGLEQPPALQPRFCPSPPRWGAAGPGARVVTGAARPCGDSRGFKEQ